MVVVFGHKIKKVRSNDHDAYDTDTDINLSQQV